jgi:hypothetical protein
MILESVALFQQVERFVAGMARRALEAVLEVAPEKGDNCNFLARFDWASCVQ